MTNGMVDIKSLLIVVVLDISAKNIKTGMEAGGDSKKVNKAQLIQVALANMVT